MNYRKGGLEFEIMWIVSFGIQRIPILFLVVLIAWYRPKVSGNLSLKGNELKIASGPSNRSRAVIVLAGLINALCDLPMNVWAAILPRKKQNLHFS
jgi:hypothetical protein